MIFGSGLGIVLSLVFGCLLLALIAELYYLLWWKKLRISTTTSEQDSHAKELFYLFCWNNNHSAAAAAASRRREPTPTIPETVDAELGSSKEFLLRALGGEQDALVEAELTRLHSRFLFTIKEETKEDLESEDGRSKASTKGSRTRSLSDLILTVDTPFISPIPSPPLTYSATKNPSNLFNPLFESSVLEAELGRLRSSPPPTFKFLRDAEEKMYRRLIEEAEKMKNSRVVEEEDGGKDGSLIRIILSSSNHYSGSSQVLPIASSPTSDIRSVDEKPTVLDRILSA